MPTYGLIVTHIAPDLDAITSSWLLLKFDQQHYGKAELAFVNPGARISLEAAEQFHCQLHQVAHVDTGLGKFDHHQPTRANQKTCATKLVHEYLCQIHPELASDSALMALVNYVTEIDNFQEIHWPEPNQPKYVMMIHELLRGFELNHPGENLEQWQFGRQCLESAYQALHESFQAQEIIKNQGQEFKLAVGQGLGLLTANDDTIKSAQKMGYVLVIRKDPEQGYVRIKATPDAEFTLKKLADEINKIDGQAHWFYHPGGKMLLNGWSGAHDIPPSSLSLTQLIDLVTKIYG